MDESESVLERIARGDPAAVRDCMERYRRLVWSLARRFSENAADAEDATQEIFVELWKHARRFDRSAGSEATFVTTIARRRLTDRLRSRGRRPDIESFDESTVDLTSDDDGSSDDQRADAAAAERALARLDPAQRQVLLLGIVEGMTHSEIASATGKPLGTVKTQMRRGLIKIRRLIESGEANADEGGER